MANMNQDPESNVWEGNQLLTRGVGTLLWCAPEVLAGRQYGLPADVYRCVERECVQLLPVTLVVDGFSFSFTDFSYIHLFGNSL